MANPASVHRGRLAVDELVVQSLMIAFAVVMLDELVHRLAEMTLAQRYHPIQALLLDRSHEPLRVCVAVRRLERRLHHAYGGFLQQVAYRGARLPIRSQIRMRQWTSAPSSSAVIVRPARIMNASFGCGVLPMTCTRRVANSITKSV
jgi:hypothetical protein